jgi:hypothetical protein
MFSEGYMTVKECPRCGAVDPVFIVKELPEATRYYCQTRFGGCGRRVLKKHNPKKNGRKPLGDQPLTPAEKMKRCIPKLPFVESNKTWYVVSTLSEDGTVATFKCLEYGTLKSLDKKYPDDQVLRVGAYPAAKQREYYAMIVEANDQSEHNAG